MAPAPSPAARPGRLIPGLAKNSHHAAGLELLTKCSLQGRRCRQRVRNAQLRQPEATAGRVCSSRVRRPLLHCRGIVGHPCWHQPPPRRRRPASVSVPRAGGRAQLAPHAAHEAAALLTRSGPGPASALAVATPLSPAAASGALKITNQVWESNGWGGTGPPGRRVPRWRPCKKSGEGGADERLPPLWVPRQRQQQQQGRNVPVSKAAGRAGMPHSEHVWGSGL